MDRRETVQPSSMPISKEFFDRDLGKKELTFGSKMLEVEVPETRPSEVMKDKRLPAGSAYSKR